MKTESLMPHHDGFPLLSRDWDDIDCKSSNCDWNRDGKCLVPSLAKIGEDGRCEGFKPRGTIKVRDERPS
jgi:hypothetical protein